MVLIEEIVVDASGLKCIPLIDAPPGPSGLLEGQKERMKRILTCAHGRVPGFLLRWGDSRARSWFERSGNPYLSDLRELSLVLDHPGGYALNFSYEWLCTTGCAPGNIGTDSSPAPRMYRTLDWVFDLGEEVIVGRHDGCGGSYYNIGWPGYMGVLTGLAPGRFAAAINQAPMRNALGRVSLGLPLDWLINRFRVARRRGLPPSHLLRRVFETCANYQEAREMLSRTPVCVPVIFTLSGTRSGESCVIERMEEAAVVHEGRQVAAANHWIASEFHGRDRPGCSRERRERMLTFLSSVVPGADWLPWPVLNRRTCLVAEMDAGSGYLLLRGVQHGQAATADFRLAPSFVDSPASN